MRPTRFRFTVRSLLAAVAGVGLLIGGSLEFVRLTRVSREFAGRAMDARRSLGRARIPAGWSHERWLTECREIDRSNRKYAPFQIGTPVSPEVARERIAYWELILSKYERLARYPWLPIEPDPPEPE